MIDLKAIRERVRAYRERKPMMDKRMPSNAAQGAHDRDALLALVDSMREQVEYCRDELEEAYLAKQGEELKSVVLGVQHLLDILINPHRAPVLEGAKSDE